MHARHLPAGRSGRWLVLAIALALAAAVPRVEAADLGTTRGYAEWAEVALASPPEGVRFLDELEQKLVELTAAERQEQAPDAPPLEADPGLQRAAQAHALDMLERGYTGHVGPDGRDVGARVAILARRFVGGSGENIAEHAGIGLDQLAGQTGPLASKLVDGWMASPGHRKNLLDPAYDRFALAAAGQGERVVIVQVFGDRKAQLAEPVPLEVAEGAALPLRFADTGGPAPQKFAFAPPGTPVEELVTLEVSANEVVVEPGEYRLQFLFATDREGYFEIVGGPALVVTEG